MSRKRGRGQQRDIPVINRRMGAGLAEADQLIAEAQWELALAKLTELQAAFPRQTEVLARMLNVAMELQDPHVALAAAEQLVALHPDQPDYALALAGAHLVNMLPALALRGFRRFLQRWPAAEQAEEIRQQAGELERMLGADLAELGLSGADALDVAALLDELNLQVGRGAWGEALSVGERVLKLRPDMIMALNNVSVAAFFSGKHGRAAAAAAHVLELDPQNHHALSNLVRILVLSGRAAEAGPYAERLRALDAPRVEVAIKQAEALALLGDDEGVLAVRSRVSRRKEPDADPQQKALLHHYGAVAALRQGREAEAKRLWKMALAADPELDLAEENLQDLELPPAERSAPWPFLLPEWMAESTLDEMARTFDPALGKSRSAAQKATRRFLQLHPEVAAIIPLLLDRGDPPGRELALQLALMADTPELNAALRDFALSARGPDDMRIEAAQAAQRAGLIAYGDVPMWSDGQWADMLLLDIEVYDGPVSKPIPRRAQELHAQAGSALLEQDGAAAEPLLLEARRLAPDDPSILNNLAMAYSLQDRDEEAVALTREIERRFPDYLFGICSRAHDLIRRGELDEAAALITPLWQRRRLHVSEVAAAMGAQLELMMARGNAAGAADWLDLWREIDPERVEKTQWDLRISLELMRQNIERWESRRQRRREARGAGA